MKNYIDNIKLKLLSIEPFKLFIYLYILILPWDFFKGIAGFFSIIMLIWWLVIGKKKLYFENLKNLYKNYSIVLLFLFLAYGLLSLIWTNNIDHGLKYASFYKYFWIVIPIVYTVFNKEESLLGLKIFLLSIGLYALFSISIYLNLISIIGSSSSDPKGILAYAIVTPYMAIATLMSLVFIFYSNSNIWKRVFIVIFILSSIALFINKGRAGQVAFLGTVFILTIFYGKYLLKYKKYVTIFIIFILIGFYVMYQKGQIDDFQKGFHELYMVKESKTFDGAFGYRAYMWFAAADQLQKTPLFGTGIGDNIDAFFEYGKKHQSEIALLLDSYHSLHLDYLTRFGIIGYLIFIFSIVVLLRNLYYNKFYFTLALAFFSIVLIDSLADVLITMKPFNNIYALVFVVFAILSDKNRPELINNSEIKKLDS